MYIFKYINNITGKEIGYHLSTFCQVGKKESAKRYQCTNGPENQIETIRKNLKYTLNPKQEGIFSDLNKSIADNYFKGLKYEDVDLVAEYLTDGITPDDIQHTIHTIVSNGEVHKVDIPLENLPEVLSEINQAKNN